MVEDPFRPSPGENKPFVMGTPFTIKSAWLFPFNDVCPRMVTFDEAVGPAEPPVTYTPASFPLRLSTAFGAGTEAMSLLFSP